MRLPEAAIVSGDSLIMYINMCYNCMYVGN